MASTTPDLRLRS